MYIKEIVMEERLEEDDKNSMLLKSVALMSDGSYTWVTSARSGSCKRLKTALKKVNLGDE